MCCDNCAWVERFDFVERRDPFPSLLRIRLGEVEMDIVVGGVAGDHESDGRDIQTGRIVRVGMTEFHSDQFVSFQINYIPLELFREYQLVWNLVWEPRLPELEVLWGGILAHTLQNVGCCDRSRAWKSFKKGAGSKPMVSMAMGNVDGCQVPVFGCNPIC